jgi:molybdate transport system substrate-binding protein
VVRIALVAILLATACGTPGDPDDVVVFAASSLTDAFTEIAHIYEDGHAPATVILNFAGSQQLAEQILRGAPADVFASASAGHMRRAVNGDGQPFARNRLTIAVERGNPLGIDELADLAADGVKVVLPATEVPAGAYAAEALRKASVRLAPVSLETDVRGVLSKVALGEADAGLVYVSDVAANDGVDAVDIPAQHNVVATYPIAALTDAGRTFVDLVLSDVGQQVLRRHGFVAP